MNGPTPIPAISMAVNRGPRKIMMQVIAARLMLIAPERACAADAREKILCELLCRRSAIANMKRLARLLPMRSPTARSGIPARTALMSTEISGREVAPARKMLPTSKRPSFVSSAMESEALARNVPARTITPAEMTNCKISVSNVFLSPLLTHS